MKHRIQDLLKTLFRFDLSEPEAEIHPFFSDIATDFPTKHNTLFLVIFHMKEDVSFGCHFLLVTASKACWVANERKFDVDYETFRCF